MDIEQSIQRVLAGKEKVPPFDFKFISCNNFPKPFINKENPYGYNFEVMVDALVQFLPHSEGYSPLKEFREIQVPLKTYLLVGLKWKLHENGNLSPAEWELTTFLEYPNNYYATYGDTHSSETNRAEIDNITSAINRLNTQIYNLDYGPS